MHQLLAPALFQNKTCRLPGIGILSMVTHAAQNDLVNGLITPPAEIITFTAVRSDEKIFNEFSALSELLQKDLEVNGVVLLKGIGTFSKDDTGEIKFAPLHLDPVFTVPVTVNRVSRPESSHAMLVGDQETTNVIMTEYFNEKPVLTGKWRIWALVLGVIGIAILIIHYLQHNFDLFSNSHILF